MSILVRATQAGYFVNYRQIGDEFYVDDESQMGSWMERVNAIPKPTKAAPSEDIDPFLSLKMDEIRSKAKDLGMTIPFKCTKVKAVELIRAAM